MCRVKTAQIQNRVNLTQCWCYFCGFIGLLDQNNPSVGWFPTHWHWVKLTQYYISAISISEPRYSFKKANKKMGFQVAFWPTRLASFNLR